jgi:hypothetical protein
MGELLTKHSNPEQFVDTVQQAADDTKNDPDIPKYTHE